MATINLKSFPQPEVIDCPKCQYNITLYDPEGSEYCACPKCYAFIRFNDQDTAVVQSQLPTIINLPVISVGSKGVINDIEFIVIGYVIKKERASEYYWREYLLYNYEKGYANLAEYDGHWIFVGGEAFYPELAKLTSRNWDFIDFEGNEYNVFNKYYTQTVSLIGEYDWNLLDEKMHISEFIAPPCIIYKEQTKVGTGDANFYLGSYMEPAEVASAFKADIEQFPERVGIGANQPSKHAERWFAILRSTPYLIIITALLGFIIAIINPSKTVLDGDYGMVADTIYTEYKAFATPSFQITNSSSALEFLVHADVDNSWMEANIVLVNEESNQTWEVTESVEYYHGYEGGESWTEGSKNAEVLLSAIPEGKYHLNIYPASGGLLNNSIHITVTENPILWRNLVVTLLLLLLYPLYCWYRMRNYEKRRWMNSSHSPYTTEDE